MKTSVISEEFRDRYLSNPKDPDAFEGRAIVFDGPEDYHARIDDPALDIDEHCMLFMRGTGPDRLSRRRRGGEHARAGAAHRAGRPCAALHRRRPPVGHVGFAVDPQRLAGGGGRRRARGACDRRPRARRPAQGRGERAAGRRASSQTRREALEAAGGYAYPASQTPWQEMQRGTIGQMSTGAVLEPAVKYQRIARTKGIPRHNH